MEVSLAIVYSIRNTRAPPWSYPPTTGNGIFLLYRRIHLCLLKLLETKNTLPLLIVLPLNMVSAVGKISRRYAALHSSENARILSASAGFRFENEEPGKGDAESPWKW